MRLGAALTIAACLSAATAHAEPPRGTGEHRIEWKYPRFRLAEATWSIGVALTMTYVEREYKVFSPDNGWHGGILFDDAVRDALVATKKEDRDRISRISNYFWHPTQYYPIVVDGLIVPLVFDKFNLDAAAQMTLLNWEVQSTTFFLLRIGHRIVGRWRPSVQGCADDPNYDGSCDPNNLTRNSSFPAGHAAMAYSGAALTCVHHKYLRIYGSTAAGIAACVATMTSATAVMMMRMVADNHWGTDSIVGAGIGIGVGIGLPYLLHYGPHLKSGGGKFALLPWVDGRDGGGLSIARIE